EERRLPREARARRGVGGVDEDLERDLLARLDVARAVDDAGPAAAETLAELEAAERRAGAERDLDGHGRQERGELVRRGRAIRGLLREPARERVREPRGRRRLEGVGARRDLLADAAHERRGVLAVREEHPPRHEEEDEGRDGV